MSGKSSESSGGDQCGRAGQTGRDEMAKKPYHIWEYTDADYHQLTLMVTRTDGTVIQPATWPTRQTAEHWAWANCKRSFLVLPCQMRLGCMVERAGKFVIGERKHAGFQKRA